MMFTLETTMKLQFVENIHGKLELEKLMVYHSAGQRGSRVNDLVKRYLEL